MISCTGVTRGAGPSAPRLPILSHASQWSCVRPYVRVRSLPCCTAQQLAATAHAKVSSAMNAVELLAALDEEDCQSDCHLVKLGLARLAGHATDTGQLAYVDSGEVARVLLKLEQALIQVKAVLQAASKQCRLNFLHSPACLTSVLVGEPCRRTPKHQMPVAVMRHSTLYPLHRMWVQHFATWQPCELPWLLPSTPSRCLCTRTCSQPPAPRCESNASTGQVHCLVAWLASRHAHALHSS
jgi:hypothetical protein